MEQTIETVLVRYAPPAGNRPGKVWDQDGKDWAIWEQPLYETVITMLHVPVQLTGETKPSADGRFENRSVRGIALSNGSSMVTPPIPGVGTLGFAVQPETPPATASTMVAPIDYQRPKHPDEQQAIRKAVALQAAVNTLPYLEQKLSDPNQVLAIAEVWVTWLSH